MALRVSFAVLLSSSIQTRDQTSDSSHAYAKKWLFFPDWYYLGGLSYCAVMVVFSMGYNVGGTIREVCQGIWGVGMALVYNCVLFAFIPVERFDSKAEDPYRNYYKINKAFNSSAYWINVPNLYTTLPWIVLFTVLMMVLPFQTNTRKYAVGTNAYFTLTIINPANPLSSGQLKRIDEELFDTSNILRNLQVFAIVGVLGACLSIATMCIPYPIFAISRLREDSQKAAVELLELLNLIVDSYCIKITNARSVKRLKRKLKRNFDNADARQCRMMSLLEDAWWEQCFGLHYPLHFNWAMSRTYIRLIGSLLADLRTLSNAMRLEQYGALPTIYRDALKQDIYVIQIHVNNLLDDVARKVHALSPHLDLPSREVLEMELHLALHNFYKLQQSFLHHQTVTSDDVAGNVPLSLFLFSLHSFCTVLFKFQDGYNSKKYDDGHRVRSFLRKSVQKCVDVKYYCDAMVWINALKLTAAVMLGVAFSVGVYGFSASVPSTIAYVMCETIGSSFRKTVNRVGGVVAGSVVPSVCKFYLVQLCHPMIWSLLLSNTVLFLWVTVCMYVYFGQGYGAYSGIVAAFVACDTLLRQTDICDVHGSDTSNTIAIASYSSLAQTSVAVVIFISVETFIVPKSAIFMLRQSIVESLTLHQTAFQVLFGHLLSNRVGLDPRSSFDVGQSLVVDLPRDLDTQRQLLAEAMLEPILWRTHFAPDKYRRILRLLHELLHNNYLFWKLLRWFQSQVAQESERLNGADLRDRRRKDAEMERDPTWHGAATRLQSLIDESFESIRVSFCDPLYPVEADSRAAIEPVQEELQLDDNTRSGTLQAEIKSVRFKAGLAEYGAIEVASSPKDETVDSGRRPRALEPLCTKVPGKLEIHPLSLDQLDERGLQKVDESRGASGNSATTCTTCLLTQERKRRALSIVNGSVCSHHSHDVLTIEDDTTFEAVACMKLAYAEWVMMDRRFEKTSMEEELVLKCFISGAESIAKSLFELQELVMAR